MTLTIKYKHASSNLREPLNGWKLEISLTSKILHKHPCTYILVTDDSITLLPTECHKCKIQ